MAQIEKQQPLSSSCAADIDGCKDAVVGGVSGIDEGVASQRRGLSPTQHREEKYTAGGSVPNGV
jgi:hypothetical protein